MSAFDPKRTSKAKQRIAPDPNLGTGTASWGRPKKEKRLSKQWKEAVADAFSPLAIEKRRAAAGLR
jgi:hypothetical protein